MTSLSDKLSEVETSANKTKNLGAIAELLASKNIDINEIGSVKRVSLYQSLTKDQDGEAQVHCGHD